MWNPPVALKLLNRKIPSGGVVNTIVPDVHGPLHPDVPGGYVVGSPATKAVRPGVLAQPQMSSTCWATTSALPETISSAPAASVTRSRCIHQRCVFVPLMINLIRSGIAMMPCFIHLNQHNSLHPHADYRREDCG